jgi:uncharacterized membrane protein
METSRTFSSSSVQKTKKLVGMAILAAIVVVLQLLAYAISNFTPLPVGITLVLIPVVVGSAIYGAGAGAFLGGVFGIVVMIACITGFDKGGAILYGSRPLITILLCLVKGVAAGYFAGIVYRLIAKKNMYLGVILAAIVCPIVNTGIFLAAMVFFYHDTLVAWAGGTNLVYFTLIGLTGINFLIEIGSNIVLGPVAVRIISAGKRGAAA